MRRRAFRSYSTGISSQRRTAALRDERAQDLRLQPMLLRVVVDFAEEHEISHVAGRHAGIGEGTLDGRRAVVQQLGGDPFEVGPAHLHLPAGPRQVHCGGLLDRQPELGVLGETPQPASRRRIAGSAADGEQVVDEGLGPRVAAVETPGGRLHLDDAQAQLDH